MPLTRRSLRAPLPVRVLVLSWAALTILLIPALVVARHHHHAEDKPPAVSAPSHHVARPEAPLFETVQTALTAEDVAGAYKALEEAYRARPSPAVLYWLGRVALAEKRPIAAQDYMRRFLIESGTEKDDAAIALRADAQKLADQPTDGSAEARMTGPKGGLLFVDDRLAGALPLPSPILLGAGSHRVAMETKHKHLDGKVDIIAGRGVEVLFDLEASAVLVSQQPVLLVLRFDRGVAPVDQAKLSVTIREAFSKTRSSPAQLAEALRIAPDFRSCLRELDCQLRLAEKSGQDYALRLNIDSKPVPTPGRADVRIGAAVLDIAVGAVSAETERTCSGCAIDATAATLREAISDVVERGLGRPRGTLTVESLPAGAKVTIDGRKVGLTPLTRDVLAGDHMIELRAPGQQPASRPAHVEASEQKTVRVQLGAEPPEVEPPPSTPAPGLRERFLRPRPRWRLITGGIAVGAGVLMVGFGSSALTQNGQCATPLMPPMNSCGYLYSTSGVGGALLGVGLTLSLGGAGLLLWPGPAAPAKGSSPPAP